MILKDAVQCIFQIRILFLSENKEGSKCISVKKNKIWHFYCVKGAPILTIATVLFVEKVKSSGNEL
jgi:hypothetical protein